MDHTPSNGRMGFLMLMLVSAANIWAKLTLNDIAACIAIIGGALYAFNQAFIAYRNIKKSKQNGNTEEAKP